MADNELKLVVSGDSSRLVAAVKQAAQAMGVMLSNAVQAGAAMKGSGEKAAQGLLQTAAAADKSGRSVKEAGERSAQALAKVAASAEQAGKAVKQAGEQAAQGAAKAASGAERAASSQANAAAQSRTLAERLSGLTSALGRVGQAWQEAAAKSSAASKKMAEDAEAAAKRTQAAMKERSEKLASFKEGAQTAGEGLRGAAAPLVDAVKSAAEFDKAMRRVDSILKLSPEGFQKLGEQVKALSKDPAITSGPTDLAKGLNEVVSAGAEGQEALNRLRVSAIAASAGQTDVATAAKSINSIMASGIGGVKTAREASDALFKTVEVAQFSFEELAGSIGQVLPDAAQAGISMQEVGSALAFMSLRGRSASESTNDLLNLIVKTADPSKEAREAFEEMGISFGNDALAAKGLSGVLAEIREKTHGNKDALRKLYPDMEAARGAMLLLQGDGKELAGALNEMKHASDGTGASMQANQRIVAGTSAKWEKLQAQWQELAIKVGEKVLPVLNQLLDWANKNPELAGAAASVGTLATATLNLAQAAAMLRGAGLGATLSGLVTRIHPLAGAVTALAAAFGYVIHEDFKRNAPKRFLPNEGSRDMPGRLHGDLEAERRGEQDIDAALTREYNRLGRPLTNAERNQITNGLAKRLPADDPSAPRRPDGSVVKGGPPQPVPPRQLSFAEAKMHDEARIQSANEAKAKAVAASRMAPIKGAAMTPVERKHAEKYRSKDLLFNLLGIAEADFGLRLTSYKGGKHADGSYHYAGRALDLAGPADRMRAFYEYAEKYFKPALTELFYDPAGGIKNGRNIGAIGKHRNHVHLAIAQPISPKAARSMAQGQRSAEGEAERRRRAAENLAQRRAEFLARQEQEGGPEETEEDRVRRDLEGLAQRRDKDLRLAPTLFGGEALKKAVGKVRGRFLGDQGRVIQGYAGYQERKRQEVESGNAEANREELERGWDAERRSAQVRRELAEIKATEAGPESLLAHLQGRLGGLDLQIAKYQQPPDDPERREDPTQKAEREEKLLQYTREREQVLQRIATLSEQIAAAAAEEAERNRELLARKQALEAQKNQFRTQQEEAEAERQGPEALRDLLQRRADGLKASMAQWEQTPPDPARDGDEQAQLEWEEKLEGFRQRHILTLARVADLTAQITRSVEDECEAEARAYEERQKAAEDADADLARRRRALELQRAEAAGPQDHKEALLRERDRIIQEQNSARAKLTSYGAEASRKPDTKLLEAKIIDLDGDLIRVNQQLKGFRPQWIDYWKNLGQDAANALRGNIQQALQGLFEGQEDIGKALLDSIRSTAAATLSQGITDQLSNGLNRILHPVKGRGTGSSPTGKGSPDTAVPDAPSLPVDFIGPPAPPSPDKKGKGGKDPIGQRVAGVAGALGGLISVLAGGKNKMAQVIGMVIQTLAMLAQSKAIVGFVTKVFGFDSPMQDSQARRWGFDFGTAFSQGALDARRSPANEGAAAGANITANFYGSIQRSVDVREMMNELAFTTRGNLRTRGLGFGG